MRSFFATFVTLFVALAMIGCAAPTDQTPQAPQIGKKTGVVEIHLMPSSAQSKLAVKITPPLPVFRPDDDPDGLVFVVKRPKGATPDWGKVGVADFVEGKNPIGTIHGSCGDLGTDATAQKRCRVVFQDPGDSTVQRIVKYSIQLTKAGSTPKPVSTSEMAGEDTEELASSSESTEEMQEPAPGTEEEGGAERDSPDLVIDPVAIIMG